MKSTYRSAGVSVEAVATRAAEKILPEVKRGVEIFFRLLVYPWGYVFVNKVAEWRRPLYLFGLNLRGQDYQLFFHLNWNSPNPQNGDMEEMEDLANFYRRVLCHVYVLHFFTHEVWLMCTFCHFLPMFEKSWVIYSTFRLLTFASNWNNSLFKK